MDKSMGLYFLAPSAEIGDSYGDKRVDTWGKIKGEAPQKKSQQDQQESSLRFGPWQALFRDLLPAHGGKYPLIQGCGRSAFRYDK